MRETKIEAKLIAETEKLEGWAPKWVSPGENNLPDRIILLPGGKIGFVETKATGKKARKAQDYQHRRLRKLGFKVFIPDSYEQVQKAINEIQST